MISKNRGEERRFANGHNNKGIKRPEHAMRLKGRKRPDHSAMMMGIGNPRYGKIVSKNTRLKISIANKGKAGLIGTKNPMYGKRNNEIASWKGDEAGYSALHQYLRKYMPKPKLCEICRKVEPVDISNINGIYDRDFKNYQWQCRKCHIAFDGRYIKLEDG
jgi:hypothetical protein